MQVRYTDTTEKAMPTRESSDGQGTPASEAGGDQVAETLEIESQYDTSTNQSKSQGADGDRQNAGATVGGAVTPVSQDDMLNGYGPSDYGNAQAMILLFGEQFLYSPVFGWMEYSGMHWQAGAEASVKRAAIATLEARGVAAVKLRTNKYPKSGDEILRATTPNERRGLWCMRLFCSYLHERDA